MSIPRFPKYSTISGDHKKLFDELVQPEKEVLSELLNSNFQTFDKLKDLNSNKRSTIRLLNKLRNIGFKKSHIKNIVGEINQSFIDQEIEGYNQHLPHNLDVRITEGSHEEETHGTTHFGETSDEEDIVAPISSALNSNIKTVGQLRDKIEEVCQGNGFGDLGILVDFGWTLEYLDNLDIYNKITRVKQSILDGSRERTGKTISSRRKRSRFTGAKKTINKTRMAAASFKKKKKKKKKKSKKIYKK